MSLAVSSSSSSNEAVDSRLPQCGSVSPCGGMYRDLFSLMRIAGVPTYIPFHLQETNERSGSNLPFSRQFEAAGQYLTMFSRGPLHYISRNQPKGNLPACLTVNTRDPIIGCGSSTLLSFACCSSHAASEDRFAAAFHQHHSLQSHHHHHTSTS